jgi:hypothetical protein
MTRELKSKTLASFFLFEDKLTIGLRSRKKLTEAALAWVAPRAGDLGEPNPSAASDPSPSLHHLAAARDGPPESRARPQGWWRRGSRQEGSRVTRAGRALTTLAGGVAVGRDEARRGHGRGAGEVRRLEGAAGGGGGSSSRQQRRGGVGCAAAP